MIHNQIVNKISNKLLQLTNWSPNTLRQKRAEKIDYAVVEQHQRIEHNDLKIKKIFKLLNISTYNQFKLKKSVNSYVLKLEKILLGFANFNDSKYLPHSLQKQ